MSVDIGTILTTVAMPMAIAVGTLVKQIADIREVQKKVDQCESEREKLIARLMVILGVDKDELNK